MKNAITTLLLFFTITSFAQLTWQNLDNNLYTSPSTNVGLGTPFPSERLDIIGNTRISGGLQSAGVLVGGKVPGLNYPFSFESISVAGANLNLRLQSPKFIYFHTDITDAEPDSSTAKVRMAIAPNGNVGVGTINPSSRFHIKGNAGMLNLEGIDHTYIQFYPDGFLAGRKGWLGYADKNDNYLSVRNQVSGLKFLTDEGEKMRILSNGNVGLGTENPVQKLEINGGARAKHLQLWTEGSEQWPSLSMKTTTGREMYWEMPPSGDLYLFNPQNNNYGIYFNQAGNVGIGSTQATERLFVNGNIRVANDADIFGLDQIVGFNDLRFYGIEGGNPDMMLTRNGNLGIGEGNPSDRLTVKTRIASVNNSGQRRTLIATSTKDAGFFESYGPNNNRNVIISGDGDGNNGFIGIYNGSGEKKATIEIVDDIGYIETNGKNGNDNVRLSSLGDKPNHGYVSVQNSSGVSKGGLYVDTDGKSVIWAGGANGGVKNFRMPHPKQSGKDIWYASIEGPEAAAFERGIGELKNGEAFISFSDHFKIVINHETMTVVLTAHSAETYGLAVVEKTAKGFRVREFKKGRGNFKFDWEVKAVRKGHEDYRVIRDANEGLPSTEDGYDALLSDDETSEENLIQENSTSKLEQNRPNPFNGSTIIPYQLHEDVEQAEIQIYSIDGKLVKQFKLQGKGEGQINVHLDNAAKGSYFYTLIVNGKLIETKQMVLVNN